MRYVLLILMIIPGYISNAQTSPEKEEIKKVIEKLFTAMHKGDSTMLGECFTNEVSLVSMFRTKSAGAVLEREHSIKDFMKAVGSPHAEAWTEEYWNLRIDIDDDFASAWCDYAFYLGKTFSHCGVDAFHLHRGENGWKIFHLSDTRRKTGCTIPEDIQRKHR